MPSARADTEGTAAAERRGRGGWLVALALLWLAAPHAGPALGQALGTLPASAAHAHPAASPAATARPGALRKIATTTSAGCDPAPDLADPRLDPRVRQVLAVLAGRWRLRVSCLHAGHSWYVAGTRRVSNHAVWRAVDLDQVNGVPVSAHNQAARALAGFLGHLQGPLRPEEIGSPFLAGPRPFFTDDGHQGHIHIGYGPSGPAGSER